MQLSNVDGSGTNVDPLCFKDGITLTNTQLATLCSTSAVAVTSDLTSSNQAQQIKRTIATASLFKSA